MKLDFNLYQNYLEIKSQIFFRRLNKCEQEQKKLLLRIINNNNNTHFGKLNNFKKINSYNTFKKIPVSSYEEIRLEIEKEKKGISDSLLHQVIQYFAITSGTTNTPKFLPHTNHYIKQRKNAWEIWIHNLYKDKPKTFALDGSILTITAKPYDGYVFNGKKFGSISGQVHDMQPSFVKFLYAIPDELLLIEDFKLKYYLSILFTLKHNLTLIVTPNPSTLIVIDKTLRENIDQIIKDFNTNKIKFLDEYEEIPKKIKETLNLKFKNIKENKKIAKRLKLLKKEKKIIPKYLFPNLQSIGCWTGGSLKIYLKEIKESYGENVIIRDIGYMASEGRFSIPIETTKSGEGILDINSNFYEFIKVSDYDKKKYITYLAHNLEIGEKYYILITNENGLYRYDINDIIKVTNFYKNTKTPLIKFIQKGKYFSSITGEKISEWEINQTIYKLQEKISNNYIKTYFVMPNISVKNSNYNYYIEFDKKIKKIQIKEFQKILELELQNENMEYKEKRESERLKNIKIIQLPKDSVKTIKKEFSKNILNESQIKEPKLIVLDKDIQTIKLYLKEYNIK
jgi:hypothetical protein